MDRQQAREYINSRIAWELPKAPKRISGYDSYICPICGNGAGRDGTGICTRDGKHWTCFKGCFTNADYLDVLKLRYSTPREQDVFALYGLAPGGRSTPRFSRPAAPPVKAREPLPADAPIDYLPFYRAAQEALHASPAAIAYLSGRGISLATADRFMVGYVPDWRSPAALRRGKNPPPTPRIIIPSSRTAYIARSIDPDGPAEYRLMREGAVECFNKKALRGKAPVFVTEGAIDALSICEVGGAAVALGSTSAVDAFLRLLERERPAAPLILMLDADAAGYAAQNRLEEGLKARAIPFYRSKTYADYKDANEHLQRDRRGFSARIRRELRKVTCHDTMARKKAARRRFAMLKVSCHATRGCFGVHPRRRAENNFKRVESPTSGFMCRGGINTLPAVENRSWAATARHSAFGRLLRGPPKTKNAPRLPPRREAIFKI